MVIFFYVVARALLNFMEVWWCLIYMHHLTRLPWDKMAVTDDIFSCILVNEKFCILIKISLKFVAMGPIDNNPALV